VGLEGGSKGLVYGRHRRAVSIQVRRTMYTGVIAEKAREGREDTWVARVGAWWKDG
jgi:hypothetical protein